MPLLPVIDEDAGQIRAYASSGGERTGGSNPSSPQPVGGDQDNPGDAGRYAPSGPGSGDPQTDPFAGDPGGNTVPQQPQRLSQPSSSGGPPRSVPNPNAGPDPAPSAPSWSTRPTASSRQSNQSEYDGPAARRGVPDIGGWSGFDNPHDYGTRPPTSRWRLRLPDLPIEYDFGPRDIPEDLLERIWSIMPWSRRRPRRSGIGDLDAYVNRERTHREFDVDPMANFGTAVYEWDQPGGFARGDESYTFWRGQQPSVTLHEGLHAHDARHRISSRPELAAAVREWLRTEPDPELRARFERGLDLDPGHAYTQLAGPAGYRLSNLPEPVQPFDAGFLGEPTRQDFLRPRRPELAPPEPSEPSGPVNNPPPAWWPYSADAWHWLTTTDYFPATPMGTDAAVTRFPAPYWRWRRSQR